MNRAPHRIRVGKDSHKFAAAHMTVFPGGTKERLHGHNFQVHVTVELRDVAFAAFLDFVEADIKTHPERIRVFSGAMHERLKALVGDIDIDLDQPLSPDDE